jgi:hypothetical protein
MIINNIFILNFYSKYSIYYRKYYIFAPVIDNLQ